MLLLLCSARARSLLTSDRLAVQLAALCVIQCVAFLQTLCRKGLLSHAGFLVIYGALLALGLAVVFSELSERRVLGLAAALANGAALVRLDGGANNE